MYQDRLRLHNLLTRAGKPEEAEVPLRDLIAAEPETFDPSTKSGKVLIKARLRLGGILHARKEYDEAIEHFERVLEIDPDNVTAQRSVEVARRARDREAAAESSP